MFVKEGKENNRNKNVNAILYAYTLLRTFGLKCIIGILQGIIGILQGIIGILQKIMILIYTSSSSLIDTNCERKLDSHLKHSHSLNDQNAFHNSI